MAPFFNCSARSTTTRCTRAERLIAFCIRSLPRSMRRAKIDFAFAGQQRNGTHFAQIHAYRVVRVDGLFHRRRVQEIGLMGGLRIEELGFFFEIEA